MLGKWLRENKYVAGILLFLWLYIEYEWLTHRWQKLINGFNAGGGSTNLDVL
jgi:thiosulfate dehydrogenase [quinone] large subunit